MKKEKKAKEQFLQNYYKVIAKLEEHNMMFKDVKKIVGLTKPKVLYYIDKNLKLSGTDSARGKHERHLFSIIDLFGFELVQELRKLYIQTEVCRIIFEIFQRTQICDRSYPGPSLIQGLSGSTPMILWLDGEAVKLRFIVIFFGGYKNLFHQKLMKTQRPGIAIPLNSIYRSVTKKYQCNNRRDDFQIEVVKDDRGEESKVVYYIKGKEIDIVDQPMENNSMCILGNPELKD